MLVPCEKDFSIHHYDDSFQEEDCPHLDFAQKPVDEHIDNTRRARSDRARRGGPIDWKPRTRPGNGPVAVAPPSSD